MNVNGIIQSQINRFASLERRLSKEGGPDGGQKQRLQEVRQALACLKSLGGKDLPQAKSQILQLASSNMEDFGLAQEDRDQIILALKSSSGIGRGRAREARSEICIGGVSQQHNLRRLAEKSKLFAALANQQPGPITLDAPEFANEDPEELFIILRLLDEGTQVPAHLFSKLDSMAELFGAESLRELHIPCTIALAGDKHTFNILPLVQRCAWFAQLIEIDPNFSYEKVIDLEHLSGGDPAKAAVAFELLRAIESGASLSLAMPQFEQALTLEDQLLVDSRVTPDFVEDEIPELIHLLLKREARGKGRSDCLGNVMEHVVRSDLALRALQALLSEPRCLTANPQLVLDLESRLYPRDRGTLIETLVDAFPVGNKTAYLLLTGALTHRHSIGRKSPARDLDRHFYYTESYAYGQQSVTTPFILTANPSEYADLRLQSDSPIERLRTLREQLPFCRISLQNPAPERVKKLRAELSRANLTELSCNAAVVGHKNVGKLLEVPLKQLRSLALSMSEWTTNDWDYPKLTEHLPKLARLEKLRIDVCREFSGLKGLLDRLTNLKALGIGIRVLRQDREQQVAALEAALSGLKTDELNLTLYPERAPRPHTRYDIRILFDLLRATQQIPKRTIRIEKLSFCNLAELSQFAKTERLNGLRLVQNAPAATEADIQRCRDRFADCAPEVEVSVSYNSPELIIEFTRPEDLSS